MASLMPRPPPPAVALIMMGKPTCSQQQGTFAGVASTLAAQGYKQNLPNSAVLPLAGVTV